MKIFHWTNRRKNVFKFWGLLARFAFKKKQYRRKSIYKNKLPYYYIYWTYIKKRQALHLNFCTNSYQNHPLSTFKNRNLLYASHTKGMTKFPNLTFKIEYLYLQSSPLKKKELPLTPLHKLKVDARGLINTSEQYHSLS